MTTHRYNHWGAKAIKKWWPTDNYNSKKIPFSHPQNLSKNDIPTLVLNKVNFKRKTKTKDILMKLKSEEQFPLGKFFYVSFLPETQGMESFLAAKI